MKTVALVVFDNFTDIDLFLPWDLFNRVRLRDKQWEVKILGTAPRHQSQTGLFVDTHGSIEEANTADVVFFTSGAGTRKLMRDESYLTRFKLNPEKQVICSMCSGSLLLAGMGLLNDISATTYPTAVEALKSFGVEVEEKPLVTHGNIATAAGCLAALDLISWVLEKTAGANIKDDVMASVQPVGKGLECIY
ncbi:DJ-1/PfpI family protein [Pseudochryseolinea flava]|uniref:Thiamine biosynthesis protein ThiJ n=1 Tax=Pseudochryseolinea flava TaxID=2059302 RepID=A0A364Y0Z9_9BACT|nr:DJ-1/PfpI family protein [Pseudochryseolinea flava]RAV99428.1 thiamine biosynthesis protein ThiJ [Pseudochryseolinea flava]